MTYSLNSLKGVIQGDIGGLAYGSYDPPTIESLNPGYPGHLIESECLISSPNYLKCDRRIWGCGCGSLPEQGDPKVGHKIL